MKVKHKLALILLFTLILNVTFATLDQKIKENEESRKELQNELKKINQQQAQNEAKQSKLEKEVKLINAEIQVVDAKIQELSQQIDETEKAISVKQQELEQARKDEAYHNERMKKRLRTMYKSGHFSYLEIVLGADDISEMLTRVDKVKFLLNYDEEMLEQLISIREFIAETKKQLEDNKQQLTAIKEEETVQQISLKAKHSTLQQKQAELIKEEQALLNIENQVVQDANDLTKILKKQYADKKAQELAAMAAKYKGGKLMWPVSTKYRRISSDFGMRLHPTLKRRLMHTGIDVPAPHGTPIYAATDGRVIHSGWLGSYGYAIIVDHGGGIMTLYGHCSSLVSKKDDYVKRGQTIAKVGTTGRSTGNHVHFEVRKNGEYVDPKPYVMK